jgi:SRSO17 transposase
VPDDVTLMTKPQIALGQIQTAHAAGLPQGPVLMDAGYGFDAKLRMGVNELGLVYVAGVLPNTLAWKPGAQPEPGFLGPKKGRRGDDDIVSLKEIAVALPKKAWRTIEWREGTCDRLASRFTRVRIHVASRLAPSAARADEW